MLIQSSIHNFRKKSNSNIEIMFKGEPLIKNPHCFSTNLDGDISIYCFDVECRPIYHKIDDSVMNEDDPTDDCPH